MSDDIDALLRFYRGRKFISVKDIEEFKRTMEVIRSLHPPEARWDINETQN